MIVFFCIFSLKHLYKYWPIQTSVHQPKLECYIRGLHKRLIHDMTGGKFEALCLLFVLTSAFRICSKVPTLNFPEFWNETVAGSIRILWYLYIKVYLQWGTPKESFASPLPRGRKGIAAVFNFITIFSNCYPHSHRQNRACVTVAAYHTVWIHAYLNITSHVMARISFYFHFCFRSPLRRLNLDYTS